MPIFQFIDLTTSQLLNKELQISRITTDCILTRSHLFVSRFVSRRSCYAFGNR